MSGPIYSGSPSHRRRRGGSGVLKESGGGGSAGSGSVGSGGSDIHPPAAPPAQPAQASAGCGVWLLLAGCVFGTLISLSFYFLFAVAGAQTFEETMALLAAAGFLATGIITAVVAFRR